MFVCVCGGESSFCVSVRMMIFGFSNNSNSAKEMNLWTKIEKLGRYSRVILIPKMNFPKILVDLVGGFWLKNVFLVSFSFINFVGKREDKVLI